MSRFDYGVLLVLVVLTVLLLSPSLHAETKLPPLEFELKNFQGTVQYQSADSESWSPLNPNVEIGEGDQIKTGPAGSVTLVIPGVSVTEVSPESVVTINTLSRGKERRETLFETEELNVNDIKLDVEEGEYKNSIRNHPDAETNYDLQTNQAVAGVRGTTFDFEVNDENGVRTSVLDGQVEFYRRGSIAERLKVGKGKQAEISPGRTTRPNIKTMPKSKRRELKRFKKRASDDLRVPPWLGEFELDGTSFDQSIKIAYENVRSLTLSGVAEVQEQAHQLSELKILGDLGQRRLSLSGDQQDWSVELSPEPPTEGEQKKLTINLRAVDSRGVESTNYSLEIVLVNPEKTGDAVTDDLTLDRFRSRAVSFDLTRDERRLVLNNSLVRATVEQLIAMRKAFTEGDVGDYLEPMSADAKIELSDGVVNPQSLRTRLNTLYPVLGNPQWTLSIEGINVDSAENRVRLNVASSYRGQLLELLGIDPSSPGSANPADVNRTREIETLASDFDEVYTFRGTADDLRLTAAASGLYVDQETIDKARKQIARWEVKSALFGLFYFYEQSSPDRFADIVHPQMQNNDDNGFNHSYSDFLTSVRADLENLSSLEHAVRVEDIQFQGGYDEARVDISWDRSARLGNTNQLWQLTDQQSTLRFQRSSPMTLRRASGDPVFGLSSAQTQTTLVRGGTLDGQSDFPVQMVESTGIVSDFDSALFPELSGEDATQIASEGCISGTIDSNPQENQTWCGPEITQSIEIPAGVSVTVQDGENVNVASGVTITVAGELTGTNCTFQAASTTWGEEVAGGAKGLEVVPGSGSNGTLKLDGCTVKDAHGALELIADVGTIDVVIKNSTITGVSDGTTRELIKINTNSDKLRVKNSTLTARRDGIVLNGSSELELVNSTLQSIAVTNSRNGIDVGGSSASLDIRGNTIRDFQGTAMEIRSTIDSFLSQENTYVGVNSSGNRGVDYRPVSASGITVVFELDVFKDFGSFAICNRLGSGTCGDDQSAGDAVEIYNSDFIRNGGADAVPAIDGGTELGVPASLLDGAYLQENNLSGTITTSVNSPDDNQGTYVQYEDFDTVFGTKSSPNR